MFTEFSFTVSGGTFRLLGSFELPELREAVAQWADVRDGSTTTAPVLAAIQNLKEELMAKQDDVLAKLGAINEQTNRMATSQEEIATAANDIASDITALKGLVVQGKDDAAALDQALTGFDSVVTKVTALADTANAQVQSLKDIASQYPEPAPPSE